MWSTHHPPSPYRFDTHSPTVSAAYLSHSNMCECIYNPMSNVIIVSGRRRWWNLSRGRRLECRNEQFNCSNAFTNDRQTLNGCASWIGAVDERWTCICPALMITLIYIHWSVGSDMARVRNYVLVCTAHVCRSAWSCPHFHFCYRVIN